MDERGTEAREQALRAARSEIHTARLSGSDLSEVLDEAIELLRQAARLGTYDILGAGLVITWFKRKKIDAARQLFDEADVALEDFERTLGQVLDLGLPGGELGGPQVGLDYLFDGLLVDSFVQNRIHDAREEAEATRDRVEWILRELDARHAAIEAELTEIAHD